MGDSDFFCSTQGTLTFTAQHAYTEQMRIFKPPPIKCNAFINLKERQRAVFILHLSGFKAFDIAQLFKLSIFTVYSHIARAYAKYPLALRFKKH
jgi:DNA-binding NarL/FixJ family response regulator